MVASAKGHFGVNDQLVLHIRKRWVKVGTHTTKRAYLHRLKMALPFFIPVLIRDVHF